MNIKNKLLLSCLKATYLVSKRQETKLSLIDEIKLSIHLTTCNLCKNFEIQTNAITNLLAKKSKEFASLSGELSEDRKSKMQELINKSLKN